MRRDIGAAGCAFRRAVLGDILQSVEHDRCRVRLVLSHWRGTVTHPPTPRSKHAPMPRLFDWRFSRLLTDRGEFLYSLSPSMVEHIGGQGSNARASVAERSIDFPLAELEASLRDKVCVVHVQTLVLARP